MFGERSINFQYRDPDYAYQQFWATHPLEWSIPPLKSILPKIPYRNWDLEIALALLTEYVE